MPSTHINVSRLVRGVLILVADVACSCPLCHTQTGEQLRAGIFNGSFGWNLLATLLPFPVFAGVVAFLYFGKPRKDK
jgi:uncharacterized membrane protein